MTIQAKWNWLALALVVLMLGLTACDEGTIGTDPSLALLNDPPRLALIANGRIVVVDFNAFGRGYTLRQISGAFLPSSLVNPGRISQFAVNPGRNGGGAGSLPPDPDPFDFDPWDEPPDDLPYWPDVTDEFPDPDPWDDPFEDPFDGLPGPLPLPFDFPDTNLNSGTMGFNNLTPGDFPNNNALFPLFSTSGNRAATSVRIPIGADPAGMVITPDGLRILVAYAQGIAVVDRKAKTVVDRIPLPSTARPFSIAVTRDGKTAYVTSFSPGSPETYAVDLASKKVITTFTQGPFARKVRMKPDGTQAWFTSFFDDSVQVIDVTSNTLGVKIPGIFNAWDLCFNPTGTRAYVSGPVGSGDVVSVIDTSTYTVIAKIPVGIKPKSLIVTPSGRHLFVANNGADTIMQIDTATNKLVRTITVGKSPLGFQFVP